MTRRIQAKVGQALALVTMLRGADGEPLTSGAGAEASLKRDYDDFEALIDPSVQVVTPPQGTVDDPDPRWNPGTDGEDGFNTILTISAGTLDAVGPYFAAVNVSGAIDSWEIIVGSGVSEAEE